jgi:formiminotetrahydrofolate cyclodeaminase
LRRRANQAFQAVICEDADRLLELRHDLFRAADRDATAFVNLMGAQRVAASTGDRAAYRVALSEAARSPIELAALALEVAVIAERRIPNAARFAASDLTAGIAICYGVVAAALATARINVALLADEQTAEMQELAKDLQAQCQALGRRAQGLTPIFATALYSDADARS